MRILGNDVMKVYALLDTLYNSIILLCSELDIVYFLTREINLNLVSY